MQYYVRGMSAYVYMSGHPEKAFRCQDANVWNSGEYMSPVGDTSHIARRIRSSQTRWLDQ